MNDKSGLLKHLPDSPGVYLMKNVQGELLYVGKAGNLRRRVSSYFQKAHEYRIEKLVSQIQSIDYKRTDTAIEALILEAELIKKHLPPFNIREKDDKSFLFVEITKEKFPRVLLVRGKMKPDGERFGPFTSASSIREALRILRRIFPFSVHPPEKIGKLTRPCFEYEIGLCPGTCVNAIARSEYMKNIRNLILFFRGEKERIIQSLEKEMQGASRALEFEKAEKLRRQLFSLQHIQDVALITDNDIKLQTPNSKSSYRIEGYDISNISGTSAVGSMVVFSNSRPDKDQYRKFKIRTIHESNDVGMLKEVLRRRFRRSALAPGRRSGQGDWPLPDLILIDGGVGQVNVANGVLREVGLKIPVVGIAKGPERKRNDFLGIIPRGVDTKTLVRVRDEAHRFAIAYHTKVRGRAFLR